MHQSIFTKKVLYIGVLACLIMGGVLVFLQQTLATKAAGETVSVWLTMSDQAHLLQQQGDTAFSSTIASNTQTINVDEAQTYQQMDGFGASFTDSSAWLVYTKLSEAQRNTLMSKLFNANDGIGLSFLRQPIGASDLTRPESGEYSYDDVPSGQTDPNLNNFSIAHDNAYILPVVKQALQLNPQLKVMGTPWSAPGWMKSSGSMEGGSLNTSAYTAYANYFVKFVQAYEAQGVPIYAITPQNEPLYVPNGYPGMSMTADEQTNFIKNNLGPAFATNSINTKILAYDHNWDRPDYPTTVLNDATANAYTAGTAFHCYGGDVSAQSTVHNSFPDKELHMTECSGGQWEGVPLWSNSFKNIMQLIIGSTRNWSRSVTRWGMVLDPNNGPYLGTGAACSQCRGVVTVDQSNGNVTYNSDYYGFGHASKFVAPGAYRIASDSSGGSDVQNVAFINPDGSKVLVAYNSASDSRTFQVRWGDQAFSYTLASGAAATFKWSGDTASHAAKSIDDATQGQEVNQFNYSSGWDHCTNCDGSGQGFYNGSNSWSNSTNATVSVRFNGSGIRFYGITGPEHGLGAFSIDNGPETLVDFYAPNAHGNRLVYSKSGLNAGEHTLKVRVTGRKNASATWNGINPDRVDILPLSIDDSVQGSGANQFNYSGSNWGHCSNCDGSNQGFYKGSNSWNNTANESVSVSFTGTGVLLYGVTGPDHGIAAISIDGGSETNVDFYAQAPAGNVLVFRNTSLNAGNHTLTIRVTGNKNVNAGWNGINPDRIDILS